MSIEVAVRKPRTSINEQTILQFAQKMRSEGLPQIAIDSFCYYYDRLCSGDTGHIPGALAQPVADLPDVDDMRAYTSEGRDALSRTVILKLNGGLGTSMGMKGPKSLLPIKSKLSFLDIIIRQVLHLRRTHDVRLPLVLMNSFNTETATENMLRNYRELKQTMPFGFLQHKVPKIIKKDLTPARWPEDPDKEWCPPGHGDLYPALVTSGILEQMLDAGFEYIFVSNSDNLGATLDLDILGYFASEEAPFLMEVARRTEADRKGGHLAQLPEGHEQSGQLILREVAQCPPEELEQFQDIRRYRYFNTNNLWIHLPTLDNMLSENGGILGLPLIRNEKHLDPTRPESPKAYQLETAMGSAIGTFPGAQAVCVPRKRFVPVKKNSDLLVLRSDAYRLTRDYELELAASHVPLVALDEKHYKTVQSLDEHFPHGTPSLIECERLEIKGDVHFGRDVIVKGDVFIRAEDGRQLDIEDDAILSND